MDVIGEVVRPPSRSWSKTKDVISDIPKEQIRSAFLYLNFPDPEVLSVEEAEQYSDEELRDLLKNQINFILSIGYDL